MKAYFITATDTDAGKTFVTAGLLEGLSKAGYKIQGFKPVASGCVKTARGLRNDDALKLIAACSSELDYKWVNPYAFEPAIAPHLAAQQAGVSINLQTIAKHIFQSANDADYVFVEGVGGWMVPLNHRESVADLAKLLGFPVIMVVNMRLGCINHALLTAQAIEQTGLTMTGWIANQASDSMAYQDDNIKSLQSRIKAPLLGIIPGNIESHEVFQYIEI
ncbi:MAG: dethiobiotin synthase [gamma proteobacterium symbiont of Taylorina sp.]|nr:dethiobiotin synthase [gamma proteobacterium symbiont of Taylorina sp.]